MNIEIFIHGTTDNGYDVYSTTTEQDYYPREYYREGLNDQSLFVETKIVNNSIYCYYTYFRNNIQSSIGRPGGYIGITLRTDCFVRNLQVMYQVMDMIYNQFIIGNILSDGENKKFVIKSLKDTNKKLIDQIVNLLSQVIQTRDVVKMDESFLGNSGASTAYNPCDIKCLNLLQEYKKAEKIIISPSASLPRELAKAQEYQNKINYIKKESEEKFLSQMRKLRKENDALQNDAKLISSKLQNNEEEGKVLKQKIYCLETELNESHHKIKQLSEQAELKKELASISEPLLRLNGLLQRIGIVAMPLQKNQAPIRRIDVDIEKRKVEYPTLHKSSNNLKFFSVILVITSILLLGVLAFQIMLFSKYDTNNVVGAHVESITEVKGANETKEFEEQSNAEEENKDNRDNQEKTKEDFQNLRIKIEGQNTYPDGLVAETGYHIGLVNKEGNYVDSLYSIKWDCIGGNIEPKIGNKVHLRTNKPGMILITCHLPNGSTIKRELKVYEKNTEKQSPASYPNKMKKEDKSIPSSKKQSQVSNGLKG